MQPSTLRLFMIGQRVLSPELVQRIGDIAYLEKEIKGDQRALRRQVAKRLRNHRRQSLQKLKLEKLVVAGYVLARDLAAWRQWRDALQLALEHAMKEIGLALPHQALLEMQIQKVTALAAETTTPLRIHVNSRTSASLQSVLATRSWAEQGIEPSIVLTDYLDDDSCVIETPNGLYEASVGREVQAFCDGVKAYLDARDAPEADSGAGK